MNLSSADDHNVVVDDPKTEPQGPPMLRPEDGVTIVNLLNELAERAWPLLSLTPDNFYLHYHADGRWQVGVGRLHSWTFDEWHNTSDNFPTIIDALSEAVEAYREIDAHGFTTACVDTGEKRN